MASEEFEAGDSTVKEANGMAKRRACVMYNDAKYVRRRTLAFLAIVGLVALVSFMLAVACDDLAESACVTQLDNKAAWAVAYSKERGQYPY